MQLKKRIRDAFWKIAFAIISHRDSKKPLAKFFPACNHKNYFYTNLNFKGRNYHTKFFLERMANPLRIDFANFRSEILPGTFLSSDGKYNLAVSSPSIMPVCLTGSDYAAATAENRISVRHNDQEYTLRNLVYDRFYYLRLDKPGSVEVEASNDFIVGDPIDLKQKKDTRYKLVLCIFIDSLTWALLNENRLEDTLPNINAFFSKGTIFNNCYTWGNWTLTSASCIVSGLSIKNHGMFHPNRNIPLGSSYKIMSEYFQDAGYLTFQSCGNWRKTPAYGYVRGYDRSIYKAEMGVEETIYPFLDHLRAFPSRSHFAWVSINDAHHAMRLTSETSVQTRLNISDHDYQEKTASKSRDPILSDPPRKARYIEEMKKIDFNLGLLFSHITDNYSDDEFLVSLVSDHGVNYLTGEEVSLAEGETHTAMMLRGGGVPTARADELVQNIDLLPSMLYFSNIESPGNLDGKLPPVFGGRDVRTSVITEVIYPGQPYQVSIKTKAFDLHLTSEHLTDEEGLTSLENSSYKLFKGGDYSTNVSEQYAEISNELLGQINTYHDVSGTKTGKKT